jgi:6-phosphofructokinase 1
MGRNTGFIALESGIAGSAEELLIPEVPIGVEELCQHMKGNFNRGKRSSIIVIAEADQPDVSFRIAQKIKSKTGFDSRICILGHIQRGGVPTAHDRVLSSRLGAGAVQALLDCKCGYMVGEINRDIAYMPLKDTGERKKALHARLSSDANEEEIAFLRKL